MNFTFDLKTWFKAAALLLPKAVYVKNKPDRAKERENML